MEIIPMMVVLICAAAGLGASALELRIPGLGRMNLEFTMDKHRTTVADDSALEDRTEGQGETENPTTSPGQKNQNPKESSPAKDDAVTTEENDEESKRTDKSEGDQTTEATKPEAVNEAPNKTTEATSVTAAKESTKSTQAKDEEQSDATEKQEAATTEKGDQTTTQAGDHMTEAAKEEAVTEAPHKTTEAKESKQSTKAKDAEPSDATEKQEAATTGKGDQTTAQAATTVDAKETTKATAKKSDEVTTESSKPTKNPKQSQDAATPNADLNPNEVTDQDEATSKADEDEDDDDFDMSDVWDDVEDPPEEFGREYDLDPKLLQSGNDDLGDFQPKLELPSDMVKDMFHKMLADGNNATEEGEDAAESGEEGGFFDRLKKFFSFGNLVEQLDTIPGKVQSLLDQFRQKKSDGLKQLREKMDASSETVGNKISEALAKLKPSAEGVPQQQCLERIQESFKQYEAALQRGIKPCIEKAQSVLGKQEGALKAAMGKFSQLLTDMQGCAQKLERSSISTFVSSIFHLGSCTANDIKSKIESTLQPRMERLSELIQRHSTALNGNMLATGSCVERQLQLPKFQQQQQELVAGGKQCLQSSSRQ